MIAALVLAVLSADPAYDALVRQAVAEARAGREEDAARTLDRAVALAPARPEARVERGGLRFLQRRYDDAIRDLEIAVRARPEDAYARDLLASTLLLTARGEPAIEHWNRLGKPRLRQVDLVGLRHVPDALARREITVEDGALLHVDAFRRTRLRLEESGLFAAVLLRPAVHTAGTVDLEVALLEQHGFGSIPELVGRGIVDVLREKVRVRYANLFGEGLTVGAEYTWEDTQPFLGANLALLRPLGFPGTVRLDGFRWRPLYDFDDEAGPVRLRVRGAGINTRSVVASRSVLQAGLRVRDRTSAPAHPDARDGRFVAFELGLDHTFWSGRRHALKGSVRGVTAGGDVRFTRGLARLVHHLHVQQPDGLPLEHGSVAVQVIAGRGSDTTPIDEMFAPGAASEMELPLRAHRQKNGGVLGVAPIARSLVLANVEWRQRLFRRKTFQLGYVLFYDGGAMGRTAQGGDETLHDVGFGLRLGLRGKLLLRGDWGHGLTDGKNALTAGIGQVF